MFKHFKHIIYIYAYECDAARCVRTGKIAANIMVLLIPKRYWAVAVRPILYTILNGHWAHVIFIYRYWWLRWCWLLLLVAFDSFFSSFNAIILYVPSSSTTNRTQAPAAGVLRCYPVASSCVCIECAKPMRYTMDRESKSCPDFIIDWINRLSDRSTRWWCRELDQLWGWRLNFDSICYLDRRTVTFCPNHHSQ